eukprot:7737990-Pyramimonas_sp.AAC.1
MPATAEPRTAAAAGDPTPCRADTGTAPLSRPTRCDSLLTPVGCASCSGAALEPPPFTTVNRTPPA